MPSSHHPVAWRYLTGPPRITVQLLLRDTSEPGGTGEFTIHPVSTKENSPHPAPVTSPLRWGLNVHSCTFTHNCICTFRFNLLTRAPFF